MYVPNLYAIYGILYYYIVTDKIGFYTIVYIIDHNIASIIRNDNDGGIDIPFPVRWCTK